MYDSTMVAPMRDELIRAGVKSLESADQVDQILSAQGTTLVVVNSVCGCAAANARPGVIQTLQHATQPDNVVTVFAGVDREAVDKARGYFKGYMPSSPSVGLIKNGECVFLLQRHEIEGRDPAEISSRLNEAIDAHCA
jgi:putative YphP/YqiW family bacilliredoxin